MNYRTVSLFASSRGADTYIYRTIGPFATLVAYPDAKSLYLWIRYHPYDGVVIYFILFSHWGRAGREDCGEAGGGCATHGAGHQSKTKTVPPSSQTPSPAQAGPRRGTRSGCTYMEGIGEVREGICPTLDPNHSFLVRARHSGSG